MGLIAVSALVLIALLVLAWFLFRPGPGPADDPPHGNETVRPEPSTPAPLIDEPGETALTDREPDQPEEGAEPPPEGETELERQAREKLEELEAKREQLRKLKEAQKKEDNGGNR